MAGQVHSRTLGIKDAIMDSDDVDSPFPWDVRMTSDATASDAMLHVLRLLVLRIRDRPSLADERVATVFGK